MRGGSLLFNVHKNSPLMVEEWKDEIRAVIENISEEILAGVMENFS
jgi:hypothetical protein